MLGFGKCRHSRRDMPIIGVRIKYFSLIDAISRISGQRFAVYIDYRYRITKEFRHQTHLSSAFFCRSQDHFKAPTSCVSPPDGVSDHITKGHDTEIHQCSTIIILFMNLDGPKYFKNAEGKYNYCGCFTVLLFDGAIQTCGADCISNESRAIRFHHSHYILCSFPRWAVVTQQGFSSRPKSNRR